MNRNKIIAALAIGTVVATALALGTIWGLRQIQRAVSEAVGDGKDRPAIAEVQLPKNPPANSVIVFDFAGSGASDATYYALGFSMALSDRIYCAPTCFTLQPTANWLSGQIRLQNANPMKSIPYEVAVKAGKALGARCIVTGELMLSGNRVTISAHLTDLVTGTKNALAQQEGSLPDLPAFQTALVRELLKQMNLQLSTSQQSRVTQPNFSRPEILKLYGQSRLCKLDKDCQDYRWRMVETDPNSSFAAIRLLEFFAYGPPTCKQLQQNAKLKQFVEDANKRFPDNSHVRLAGAWLSVRRCEYRNAEKALKQIVVDDPRMASARAALATTAVYREDGQLAVSTARELSSLWPTHPQYHCVLANAYGKAAHNARHGHFFDDMSPAMEKAWRTNSQESFKEAQIAVGLDKNCAPGWRHILSVARELDYGSEVRHAFEELVRICPTDTGAYTDYAFCYSPQWGGSEKQQRAIVEMAEKALGADSAEALLVRANIGLCNIDREHHRTEILQLAEQSIAKSKGGNESATMLKCKVLMGLKRRSEMLEVARLGFDEWPTHEWRLLLAKGYEFEYEDQHDPEALKKAAELLKVYIDEIPFSPYGHNQLGWCLSHLGRREEAKKEFLKTLEIDPTNEMAREKLQYVQ